MWTTNGDQDCGQYWRAGNALSQRWNNKKNEAFNAAESGHSRSARRAIDQHHSEKKKENVIRKWEQALFSRGRAFKPKKKDSSRTHLGHSRHGQEEQGEEDELRAQKHKMGWHVKGVRGREEGRELTISPRER